MKEDREIDRLFQSQAEAFRPKVPTDSWNRLAAAVHRRRRKRVFLWAASIALLISAGGGVVLSTLRHDLNPSGQFQTAVTKNTVVKASDEVASIPGQAKPDNTATEQSTKIESKKSISEEEIKPATGSRTALPRQDAKLLGSEEKVIISPNELSNQVIHGIAELPPAISADTSSHKEMPAETPAVFSPLPPNPPFATLPPLTEPEPVSTHARAFFSVSSGPEYSSYFGNTSRFTPATQTFSGLQKGLMTPTLRLEGGYFLSSSFALSSGVQKGSFGHLADFISPSSMSFVRVNEFGRTDAGTFKAVYIEEMMHKSGIESVEEFSKFDKVRIAFEYFDVPVSLTYSAPLHKYFKFGLSGGINTALIEQNRVSLRKQDEWFEVGIIENTRKQLFGVNSGLSLEYYPEFLHGLGLFARTGYRYYFTSVSGNDALIYRPYSLDVLAGLKYRLR